MKTNRVDLTKISIEGWSLLSVEMTEALRAIIMKGVSEVLEIATRQEPATAIFCRDDVDQISISLPIDGGELDFDAEWKISLRAMIECEANEEDPEHVYKLIDNLESLAQYAKEIFAARKRG